mmetsp:Transcript_17879/g.67436  ORF Transcript_17879/g.67436 Transcript_17879/m.67436 type:complete len:213 (-) Transcript_17879:83-721(-)
MWRTSLPEMSFAGSSRQNADSAHRTSALCFAQAALDCTAGLAAATVDLQAGAPPSEAPFPQAGSPAKERASSCDDLSPTSASRVLPSAAASSARAISRSSQSPVASGPSCATIRGARRPKPRTASRMSSARMVAMPTPKEEPDASLPALANWRSYSLMTPSSIEENLEYRAWYSISLCSGAKELSSAPVLVAAQSTCEAASNAVDAACRTPR